MYDKTYYAELYKNYISYTAIKDVLADIETIDYAIVKGVPLAVYLKQNDRVSSDIDFLINRKDADFAFDVFVNNGFEIEATHSDLSEINLFYRMYTHQLPPIHKPMNRIMVRVDINFNIYWGEHNAEYKLTESILADYTYMEKFNVRFRTLPPIQSFIHMCLHHYKDINSLYILYEIKRINPRHFFEVCRFIEQNRIHINPELIRDIAQKYQALPYVYYMLYYTGILYPDSKLKDYIECCKTDDGEALLNCYGLNSKERKVWRVDFKERINRTDLDKLILNDFSIEDMNKSKYYVCWRKYLMRVSQEKMLKIFIEALQEVDILLGQNIGLDNFTDNLYEMGVDSICMIFLLVRIEEIFNIKIPNEYMDISELDTLEKVWNMTNSLIG